MVDANITKQALASSLWELMEEVTVMNVRHYIHSPEELRKQGKEIVKQSAEPKLIHRVSMVNLILGDMRNFM